MVVHPKELNLSEIRFPSPQASDATGPKRIPEVIGMKFSGRTDEYPSAYCITSMETPSNANVKARDMQNWNRYLRLGL